MYKRLRVISILVTILMIMVILSGCGSGSSSGSGDTEKLYEWKIGAVDPESYFMTELLVEWADEVTKQTDGRIKCTVFPSGQLGSDNDMLVSLKNGTLQVWEGGSNAICAASSDFDAWSLPYLYSSTKHKYNFWDNNFEEVSDMLASSTGLRILSVIDGPNREMTTNKPINTIDDLKGLKIRVPEIQPFIKLWTALGASPTAMAFSEVFTALQTKVIEAQENDILLCDSSSFFDVCKYLIMTDHCAYEGFITINDKVWNELPDDLKSIVKKVSKDIMLKSRTVTEKLVEDTTKKIVEENGVTVITPTDIEEFQKRGKSIYKDYPHVSKIIDLISAAPIN